MRRILQLVGRVAATDASVLITGESGTGKELVAEALHLNSRRAGRPFVKVNLGGISSSLFESEMFGHVRGAFTDARADRKGRFELAHTGTIFLDEIGDLDPASQVKMLRVLQDRTFEVLGSSVRREVDVRVVSATNRPLTEMVARGEFREDLLYRINLISVHLPPLRERREDIPALADHFWRATTAHTGSRARLAPSLLAALAAHDWPGNARELQNAVAAIAVQAPARGLVRADDLPGAWGTAPAAAPVSLDAARRAFEAAYVRAALARCGYRPGAAARDLGLTRQGLAKLMARLGLRPAAAPGPLRPAM
jgi:two-component system NtrC family response regulator